MLPPSLAELESRLRKRATDDVEVIERRLEKAKDELKHYGLYHYLIVNDDLPRAYDKLRAIYLAAQCGIDRTGYIAEALVREAEAEPHAPPTPAAPPVPPPVTPPVAPAT